MKFVLYLSYLVSCAMAARFTISHDMDCSISIYSPDSLLIQVEVHTEGWVGLGFGTNMENADIFVMMHENGFPVVKDMTGQGHKYPLEDSVSDYQLIEARPLAQDMTLFRIVRPFTPQNPMNPFLNKNTQIDMVWAFMRRKPEPSYHHMNHGEFRIIINDSNVSLVDNKSYEISQLVFIIHSYLMWITWGAFCLVQLIFVRWCRHWWKYGYIVHSVLGTFTIVTTLGMGYPGMVFHWRGAFSLIGLFFISGCGVLGIIGAYYLVLVAYQRWKINSIIRVKRVHYYFGYLIIILGQILTFIGFDGWRSFNKTDYFYLFYIHIAGFASIVVGFEIFYQIFKRKETPFKRENLPIMTSHEFHEQINQGKRLTIVEDLVLDIDRYISKHPGGSFAMEECVGRDSSKFIYGAYTFEQNKGVQPYLHSNYARVIVNQLAIAFIDRVDQSTICKITDSMDISMTTKIVTFQGQKPIFQTFYSDVHMMGKHYMIQPVNNPKLKRQYTICNVMEEATYENYVMALDEALNGDEDCIDLTYEDEKTEDFVIGIKNYFTQGGLATLIADLDYEQEFLVKGPMGHGLGLQRSGTQVAFCGGTGIFVFVDLVAHLVRKFFDQLTKEEENMFDDDFKLVLYGSFPNRDEAYAIELIEKFDKVCKMRGWKHYELRLRISCENKQRWDKEFIRSQMKEIGPVKRVWVTGPPIMEDEFIRIFDDIGKDVGVTKEMLDIM